jgi:hypothetical protein
MWQRSHKIIVVLLFFISVMAHAQSFQNKKDRTQLFWKKDKTPFVGIEWDHYPSSVLLNFRSPVFLSNTSINKITRYNFSQDYCEHGLGFFCKQEMKFEKYTSIPLRIRIGSLEYTNFLEQKPNALKPH